jgi:protease I
MQNAGANYVDEPLVIDGNLITARRPGDLPMFTTAILTCLGLSVPDTTLPDVSDRDAGWWKLGEEWGGSSKRDIVDAINTAIAGERYGMEAFQHYADRTSDLELRSLFQSICATKQHHLERLEERLQVLGEQESLRAVASGTLASLKSWLQNANDEQALLRQALGDLQTGVVDTYALRNKLTDPTTSQIFDDMEIEIAKNEQRVADLYQSRSGSEVIKPPQPTSGAAVSG